MRLQTVTIITLFSLIGCRGLSRLTGQPTTRQDSYDTTPLLSFPAVQVFQGTLTASVNTVYVGNPTVLSIIVKVRWHGWVYQILNERDIPGYTVFGNVVSFQGVPYPADYWIQVTRTTQNQRPSVQ